MRDLKEIPSCCGECRFFARNTCYYGGHYRVNKFTPVCSDIINMQGGYTNDGLWNDECRTLREMGLYDKRKYLGL